MSVERHFLGVEKPALRTAVEFLIDRYSSDSLVDMNSVTVVLPGARAGRRLRRLLLDALEQRQLRFLPPAITTVSHVPELLYQAKRPFASPMVQQLAWADALNSLQRDLQRRLFPGHQANGERSSQVADRLQLGLVFWRRYRELAAEGLSFSDVAESVLTFDRFPELARWQALATLQEEYLRRLDALHLWDRQTARLVAVRNHECVAAGDVVLLATPDIPRVLRSMLEQVEERIVVLINASPAWEDRFDGMGILVPDRWQDCQINIEDDSWKVADDPTDQACQVVDELSSLDGKYAAHEITIGCADEKLVPYVQRSVAAAGHYARWGPGQSALASPPCKLLAAIGTWLSDRHGVNFAALVRHVDFEAWLRRQGVQPYLLDQLDAYLNVHLPTTLTDWLGKESQCAQIQRAVELTTRLLRLLDAQPRPLSYWAEVLNEIFRVIYADTQQGEASAVDSFSWDGCEALHAALTEISEVPASLATTLEATEAIDLVLASIASTQIPPPTDDAAIEMLGWLELPLDDAACLVVAGVNEGIVPQAVSSDLFLPDTLRRFLAIDDNARRFARDAYAMSVLVNSREVRLITGRTDAEGNPLKPSRLVFADRDDVMVRRWQRFAGGSEVVTAREFALDEVAAIEPLSVPRPAPLAKPVESLRITDFAAYLACPYRFYLARVLRLRQVDDRARELSPLGFGSLVHNVLERFGRSDIKHSCDAPEIQEFLRAALAELTALSFGATPLPAVLVQLEQVRLRLDAFADVQARLAADGWRIESVEEPSSKALAWVVDGQPIEITGRIDRIDRHVETGAWRLLDYKTSETRKTPDKSHQSSGEWTDLQLPLYRQLAQLVVEDCGSPQLGYFNLPRDRRYVRVDLAEWSADELETADEVARQVVRDVRDEIFWPPKTSRYPQNDPWAEICMVGTRTVLQGDDD